MKVELWDQDAEEGLLGAMMHHPAALREAQEAGLKADHFHRPQHQILFRALETSPEPLNAILLSEKLEVEGSLEEVGGRPFVHTISQTAGLTAHASRYAAIIIEHASLRRLHLAGRRIVEIAEEHGDVIEKLAAAEAELDRAIEGAVDAPMQNIGPSMLRSFQGMSGGAPVIWMPSGFRRLDSILVGLRPGKLICLAARPGDGKSTLAINMAEHVASTGKTVGIFSLEMSEQEIGLKLAASLGKVEYGRLVDHRVPLTEQELEWLRDVWPAVRNLPFIVSDRENTTMADVRAKARYLKRTRDLGLIVVDYLQLMVGQDERNRNNAIGEITRGMKLLARDIETPIVLISQLNRAAEARKDKRPQLSDLRDSGSIEQDSDQVIFIHRPEMYEGPTSTKKGVAELIIAKNRDGMLGHVNLTFVGSHSKFVEKGSPTDPHSDQEVLAFGQDGDG